MRLFAALHKALLAKDAPLEEHAQHSQHRRDAQHQQAELPVHPQKHRHNAHHEKAGPAQVYKAPGYHVRKARHVRAHARHQPAHAGGVVEAEAQLLQMGEGVLPDVVADVHFQPPGPAHEEEHAQALHGNDGGVQKRKGQSPCVVPPSIKWLMA